MTMAWAVGDRLPTLDVAPIPQDAVTAYVASSGDDNPIHIDAAAAHAAGLEGVTLPGMLIMGQIPRLLAVWDAPHRLVDLHTQFLAPVLVGRALRLTGRVVALRSAPARAILRLTIQDGRAIAAVAEAVIAPETG